jgi:hypothetical protein
MKRPIIGIDSNVQINFKRTTDTSNLVRQGPVFAWHQRAIAQVINTIFAMTRGLCK